MVTPPELASDVRLAAQPQVRPFGESKGKRDRALVPICGMSPSFFFLIRCSHFPSLSLFYLTPLYLFTSLSYNSRTAICIL